MLMSTSDSFHSIGERNFHWTDDGRVRFRMSQSSILVIAKHIQTAVLTDQCCMVVATGSTRREAFFDPPIDLCTYTAMIGASVRSSLGLAMVSYFFGNPHWPSSFEPQT